MHIAINAQLLSFDSNYANAGVSRYIRTLITGLSKYDPGNKHTYYVQDNRAMGLLGEGSNDDIICSEKHLSAIKRIIWEQTVLPYQVKKTAPDVFHSTVNVLPAFLGKISQVVTIHDLAFMRFPKTLTKQRYYYQKFFSSLSAHQASQIITVSESTKQDIITFFKVKAEKIHVVYPAIDPFFKKLSSSEEIEHLQSFKEEEHITYPFLLFMGTLEPRKNLITLISAYDQLRRENLIPQHLVIAGSKGWLYESIFTEVRNRGLAEYIHFPGFVPTEKQIFWYNAADVFVYPSLYEGFGLPVAEALACGVPTITSNVSSLPEIAGDAAVTVDPHDIDSLAQAMLRCVGDSKLRNTLQEAALERARLFSLQHMIEGCVEVYNKAVC